MILAAARVLGRLRANRENCVGPTPGPAETGPAARLSRVVRAQGRHAKSRKWKKISPAGENDLQTSDVCSRVMTDVVGNRSKAAVMSDRTAELGSAELEALKVLWDHGACTVRQVLTHLHARGKRVAYTTVLTFLTRLEQKGLAKSNKSGMAYVYRAAVTRDRVSRNRLQVLVEQLYDGAAGSLVLQLVKSQSLSKSELDELRALISKLDAKRR